MTNAGRLLPIFQRHSYFGSFRSKQPFLDWKYIAIQDPGFVISTFLDEDLRQVQ
jgi:hypothetical protein